MAATYTPIASITVGTATNSVTFSSIPQTYTDLVVVSQMQLTTGSQLIFLRFNSDGGTNYSVTRIYGDGSSATSDRYTSQSGIDSSYVSNTARTIANINIQNYSNSTTNKSVLGRWNSSSFTTLLAGLWRNTNAITSVTLTANGSDTFIAGSTFNLYGILGANA
jgi:hypothetical protein